MEIGVYSSKKPRYKAVNNWKNLKNPIFQQRSLRTKT